MEGDPAGLKALQEMCKQCTSSTGMALKMNVLACLKHDNIFVFSELLQLESVRNMKGDSSLGAIYDAVELFAYGTYDDYKSQQEKFSFLKKHHLNKLKKLTILSLAGSVQELRYATLLQKLELETVRELEDVLIECMYLGVLKGKLDQRNQRIAVNFSLPRDVRATEVPDLIRKLEEWAKGSQVMSENLGHQIAEIQTAHTRHEIHKQELNDHIAAVKVSLSAEGVESDMLMMEGGAGGILGGLMGNLGRRSRKRRTGKDSDPHRRL